VVAERCKLKVEKKAKKASSSLLCDSAMSRDGVQVASLFSGKRMNGIAVGAHIDNRRLYNIILLSLSRNYIMRLVETLTIYSS
jgi:hypothetical protein